MDPFPIFLLAAAGFGLYGAWKMARQTRQAAASRAWPMAEGCIERSEVVQERVGHGSSSALVYVPRIEYVYEVAGRAHRARRITFANELYTSWPDRARKKCDRYFEGAKVPVHYDPADPDTACLERFEGSPALGWLLTGALATLGASAAVMAASLWLPL